MNRLDLFLVRHGECGGTGYIGGGSDPGLDETGRRQAETLGRFFFSRCMDAVYVSPLKRARETAEIVAAAQPAEKRKNPKIMDPLREMHFGEWEGLSYDEVASRNGGLLKEWIDDPERKAPPGGEEFEVFSRRVRRCFEEITSRRSGGSVLVVSHGGVLRVFLGKVLGLDFKATRCFSLNRGSVSLVRVFSDGVEILEYLNLTPEERPLRAVC